MAIVFKIKSVVDYIFGRVFILFEFILFLRLILKFLGANPETFIVKRFYGTTESVIWPFYSIFKDYSWDGYRIEMATVSSMIGYAILFFFFYVILIFIFTTIKKFFVED